MRRGFMGHSELAQDVFARLPRFPARRWVKLLAGAVLATCVIAVLSQGRDVSMRPFGASRDVTKLVHNATLGFEKIFYISMDRRKDRQVAMDHLAKGTGVEINLVEAFDARSPDVQLPQDDMPPAEQGCYISHVKAWKRVVEEDLETALILEDDVDWDLHVHTILEKVAWNMRESSLDTHLNTEHENKTAPYGLNWDVFYVGSCIDTHPPERNDPYHAYPDPLGPYFGQMKIEYRTNFEQWGLSTTVPHRVIAKSWQPICTFGYAVTRQGARKLLQYLDTGRMWHAVDIAIGELLKSGELSGFSVVPPVITAFRTGSPSADSDIRPMSGTETEDNSNIGPGWSENLRNSARLKLGPPPKR